MLKILQGFNDKNDTIVGEIVHELLKEKESLLDTEAGFLAVLRSFLRSFILNFVMFCRNTRKTHKHWGMISGKSSSKVTK